MIAWFARNPVAANLLMIFLIVSGWYALSGSKLPVEVFPEFPMNQLSIRVPYRGATPEEVEESVVKKIEEAIADVEGIERIMAFASEGMAMFQVEIDDHFDRREVLDDVKNRVDAIFTFPPDVERPIIALAQGWRSVISVVLGGDLEERDMHTLGEQVRDEIAGLGGGTSVELRGVRKYEIALEIDENTLNRYGLSFDRVAQMLRASSIDVSAGMLKTDGGQIALRTKGRAYNAEDFRKIVIVSREDGTRITLGEIATIRDGFEENPYLVRFNGKPCVMLSVSREGTQSALEIAKNVKDYMAKKQAQLPPGMTITYWSDMSQMVKNRVDTLSRNLIEGMTLVLVVLALFMRLSLAFWVTLCIPVCFLAGLGTMPFTGVSINSQSLFGFILVLGMLVDDSIVTGENIYHYQQQGLPPLEAAIKGTQEIAQPVVFGVLTTVLAFVPLLFGTGFNGRANSHIALVVIPVLLFSIVQAQLIMPSQMRRDVRKEVSKLSSALFGPGFVALCGRAYGYFEALRTKIDVGLNFVRGKLYQPFLGVVLNYRYVALAIFLGSLLLVYGLVESGRVKRVPFPTVASERATCALTMQEGTPFEATKIQVERIEAAAQVLKEKYLEPDGKPIILNILSAAGGQGLSRGGGTGTSSGGIGQLHMGEVSFMVLPPEERQNKLQISEIVEEWRVAIGEIVGSKSVQFRAEIGRGGEPIDVQITGPSLEELGVVAQKVRAHLATYPDLRDINDTLEETNDELQIDITPEGEQVGLKRQMIAQQIRQAFYGAEVQRIQRGRDEVRVMLRYPESMRKSVAYLKDMRIRTPEGREVPFSSVAIARKGKSMPRILRIDRNLAINVKADADKKKADIPTIQRGVRAFMDQLKEEHPINYSFEGEARDQRENAQATKLGWYIVGFGMFAMLAIPLRSFLLPLIVMSVIPFGLVGAVLGHLIEGIPLSMMSELGVVALAGVVVKNSLLMVDYVMIRTQQGMSLLQACLTSGAARFRPILFTTFTTSVGLYPLLSLRSTQAQFLIPMAVSLAYGVVFATVITLFLVPVVYLVLDDVKVLLGLEKRKPVSAEDEPLSGLEPAAGV